MIQVKVKAPYKIEPALNGDVGCDVLTQEDIEIYPQETFTVRTGIYVELPEGVEVQVRPKSGLSSKGLLVHWGTVDTGYRGEILVTVTYLGNLMANIFNPPYRFKKGDKIAQLVFKRYEAVKFELVDEIDKETERGENGHGSTGR